MISSTDRATAWSPDGPELDDDRVEGQMQGGRALSRPDRSDRRA